MGCITRQLNVDHHINLSEDSERRGSSMTIHVPQCYKQLKHSASEQRQDTQLMEPGPTAMCGPPAKPFITVITILFAVDAMNNNWVPGRL
jgi:hypothetical protein